MLLSCCCDAQTDSRIDVIFRAPVLVAIALIEEGMDPMESIAFIRKHRRGAINKQQIAYLEKYRKRRQDNGCVIS